MNGQENKKELVPLSPSRIDQFSECSWKYYCSSKLKLPQKGNDGNKRGSSLHDTLQYLVRPKHRHLVEELLKTQNPDEVPVIRRFLDKQIRKQKLNPDGKVKPISKKDPIRTNKEEINAMLMLVINLELKHPKELIATEYAFDFVDEEFNFRCKGFIDQLCVEDDKLIILDFKTSKARFTEDKLNTNLQALIYTMVVKKKYPDFKGYAMKFLFTRFPNKPYQEAPAFTLDTLEGLKHYLAYISNILNNFTEKHAISNFAADNKKNSWLCGMGSFRCDYRDPFDYWQIINKKTNKIIKSGFLDEAVPSLKETESLEFKHYSGCPRKKVDNYNQYL